MKHTPARSRSAFTLMEMLLVLGIIAILAGLGTFFMTDVLGDAEEGKVRADIQTMKGNLIRYKTKGGIYPTTEQGLEALVRKPTTGPQPRSHKQFVDEAALYDPWGNPYQYRRPGTHNPEEFDIFSLGKDGEEGTEDDIGNW